MACGNEERKGPRRFMRTTWTRSARRTTTTAEEEEEEDSEDDDGDATARDTARLMRRAIRI